MRWRCPKASDRAIYTRYTELHFIPNSHKQPNKPLIHKPQNSMKIKHQNIIFFDIHTYTSHMNIQDNHTHSKPRKNTIITQINSKPASTQQILLITKKHFSYSQRKSYRNHRKLQPPKNQEPERHANKTCLCNIYTQKSPNSFKIL